MSHKHKNRNRFLPTQSAPVQTNPTTPVSSLQRQNSGEFYGVKGEFFSGPIPPPNILGGYNDVVPGAADRIIKMAEEQSAHRRGLEKTVIDGDSKRAYLGVLCGFAIGLAGLYFGYQLIRESHPISGSFYGGGSLVGLVSVFIYGTRAKRKEREQKREEARKVTNPQKTVNNYRISPSTR